MANLGILVVLLLTASETWAQETRAQLLGRVADSSGAVVAGATIKATNTGTGVTIDTVTNTSGDFLVPFLVPGNYKLSVSMQGFKEYVQEGIPLRVSDRVTINVTLDVGQLTESVRITGQAPLIEAATASMGAVIDTRRVAELPLKDGNPVMLANLSPGVLNFTTGGWTMASAVGAPSGIGIDGVRSGNNEFSMDGAPNTQRNIVAYAPPAETVQEFRIQTASFDAAQGFTPGGTINLALKSGTNAFHGSAYYFHFNPIFNANSFFANRAGQPKIIWRMHRYGLNFNGPVVIPKLIDGRNKTFFMYGWEGFHEQDPRGSLTSTVPTADQVRGDFSSMLRLGANYQIYDPTTIAAAPNGRFSRQPLAGNIVPASRIHPLSSKLAALWSAPNIPGTADGQNNWYTPGPEWMHYHTHLARIDHNINTSHRVFFRVNENRHEQEHDVRFNRAAGNHFFRFNRGFNADDVYMFSPGFLVNTRYSYTRFIEQSFPYQSEFDLLGLGFSNRLVDDVKSFDSRGLQLPRINVAGYGELSPHTASSRQNDIHSMAANFTHVVRSHSMRYGIEYRVYRENTYSFGQASGRQDFSTNWTRGPLDSSPASPFGQGFASFLYGLPTGGLIQANDSFAEQSTATGVYFQDDWKLSSKLTLTLGVRYETESPITERFNRSVRDFDINAAPPQLASITPPVKGGLVFASAQNRNLATADRNNIMPRIGIAWAITPKLVVRSGYGLFFDQLGITRRHVNLTGYNRQTDLVPSLDNGQTFVANIANPFPNGFAKADGTTAGLNTFLGQGVSFFNQKIVAPYMQRWQFSIQRQLTQSTMLEVAYVGNRGNMLRIGRAMNAIPAQYLSTSPVRDQNAINFLGAALPNPYYPLLPGTSLSATTVARSQLFRPYPQFTGVSYDENQGYSWYHSMQTRFEKQFAHGFTSNVSWTWSKFMEAASYLNESDPLPERVISDQDRTHRLVLSGLYELPVGPGRHYWNGVKGVAGKVLEGWQISMLTQFQSGPALGFGNSIFNGDLHDIVLPNSERTINRWFNTEAGFNRNSAQQLGSNIRTMPSRYAGVRADGINNWDISALKNTQITESVRAQLRWEWINAFNHAQFAAPNTSPISTAFGTVTGESQISRVMQFALKFIW